MKYPSERYSGQLIAQPLRFKKIPLGTAFVLLGLIEGTMRQRKTGAIIPNDVGIFQSNDGNQFRIPMREFLKFSTGNMDTVADFQDKFGYLPDRISIVASSDRKDQNGRSMYPIEAYLLAQEFIKEEINYQDLLNGGFRNNHRFDPIQDYTIAVL